MEIPVNKLNTLDVNVVLLAFPSSLFQSKRISLIPDRSITSARLKSPRLTLAGLHQGDTSDLKSSGPQSIYYLQPQWSLHICFSISRQSRSFIPPAASNQPSMALCLLGFPYQSLIDKGKLLGPPSTNLALDPSPCTIHRGF